MNRRPARHRPFVFWVFALFFGGLTALFALSLVLTLLLATDNFPPDFKRPLMTRPSPMVCLIPLGFILLAWVFGNVGFRRLARPFADVMAALDSVAEGNFRVRLSEYRPRQLRKMALSFNRMAAELERAEAQRRNLTADIAHELRNPLHIIQGNLEGMLDGVFELNRDNLTATLDETRLLARLVADMQTISLAEAGQLPLHPTRFPAADLLEDVAASFSALAGENGVTLQALAADLSIELFADYDRLDQALSNLVANALRFTPAGGRITLSAEAAPGLARITVADTGAGIAADDLPFIFDRFWKGDRARTRDGTGSGLGLAIVRQLVRAHGGNIEASSQPGQGTSFVIELPAPPLS